MNQDKHLMCILCHASACYVLQYVFFTTTYTQSEFKEMRHKPNIKNELLKKNQELIANGFL